MYKKKFDEDAGVHIYDEESKDGGQDDTFQRELANDRFKAYDRDDFLL